MFPTLDPIACQTLNITTSTFLQYCILKHTDMQFSVALLGFTAPGAVLAHLVVLREPVPEPVPQTPVATCNAQTVGKPCVILSGAVGSSATGKCVKEPVSLERNVRSLLI